MSTSKCAIRSLEFGFVIGAAAPTGVIKATKKVTELLPSWVEKTFIIRAANLESDLEVIALFRC
ncbi:unnamed protein product [Clonostachys rhizophaga]|uniref:Uncharacterized protein n=1 Tax=Clonostachys rhizophaga TaxID=160324 RepID=A0A9N9V1V2_9HYPO|nr:unnamed protein product [Clonostachys rhizophaga]